MTTDIKDQELWVCNLCARHFHYSQNVCIHCDGSTINYIPKRLHSNQEKVLALRFETIVALDERVGELKEKLAMITEPAKLLYELIEDGTLVRDVSNDHKPDWIRTSRALDVVLALKRLRQALKKLEGK